MVEIGNQSKDISDKFENTVKVDKLNNILNRSEVRIIKKFRT